jgi:hypothetical protein
MRMSENGSHAGIRRTPLCDGERLRPASGIRSGYAVQSSRVPALGTFPIVVDARIFGTETDAKHEVASIKRRIAGGHPPWEKGQ